MPGPCGSRTLASSLYTWCCMAMRSSVDETDSSCNSDSAACTLTTCARNTVQSGRSSL